MPGTSAGISSNFQVKSANYTILNTDAFVQGNVAAGGFNLTLPDARSYANVVLIISATGGSTNTLTINTQASQTINGNATYLMGGPLQASSAWFVTDGANWQIFEQAFPPTLRQTTAQVALGASTSNASTTFATVISQSITTTGNSKILVFARITAHNSAAGAADGNAYRIFNVTSSTVLEVGGGSNGTTTAGNLTTTAFMTGTTGIVAAGTYSIALQWSAPAGTAVINIGSGQGSTFNEGATIYLQEVTV